LIDGTRKSASHYAIGEKIKEVQGERTRKLVAVRRILEGRE
jgi:hypothetical protein